MTAWGVVFVILGLLPALLGIVIVVAGLRAYMTDVRAGRPPEEGWAVPVAVLWMGAGRIGIGAWIVFNLFGVYLSPYLLVASAVMASTAWLVFRMQALIRRVRERLGSGASSAGRRP